MDYLTVVIIFLVVVIAIVINLLRVFDKNIDFKVYLWLMISSTILYIIAIVRIIMYQLSKMPFLGGKIWIF
jgi:hypothetical protein